MYEKYQSDALVFSSREHGEADRVYTLYTRDFGLVRARASAVRMERSKMRPALQHCAHVSVGLVRGARGWRLAGATVLHSAHGASEEALRAYSRLGRLLERLVVSDERHEYLFVMLSEAHAALLGANDSELPAIELLSVARMLHALGYLAEKSIPNTLLSGAGYGMDGLVQVETLRPAFLASVNRALSETHL